MSAPKLRRSSTQSSHPFAEEAISGVTPSALRVPGDALASSSSLTHSGRPSRAAQCSAVLPPSPMVSTLAPSSRASRMAATSPRAAASSSLNAAGLAASVLPAGVAAGARPGEAAGATAGDPPPNAEPKKEGVELGRRVCGEQPLGRLATEASDAAVALISASSSEGVGVSSPSSASYVMDTPASGRERSMWHESSEHRVSTRGGGYSEHSRVRSSTAECVSSRALVGVQEYVFRF